MPNRSTIAIPHYEQARTVHADQPGLREMEYAVVCREEMQAAVSEIDADQWHQSRLCESFTAQFVTDVGRATTVLDLGAERGYYAYLTLKHMPPGGKIIALEPDPVRYSLLCALFAENDNVRVHQLAAGDKTGTTTFVKPSGCSATAADVDGDHFKVETVALDDLLRGERIDVVKMDIEGAEAAALSGMARILAEDRPRIFLEYHPWVEQVTPGGTALIRDLLTNAGYKFYRTDTGQSVPTDRPGGRMYLVPEMAA